MTTPWPDPPGTPEPRTEFASGAAMYTGQPHGHHTKCEFCDDWLCLGDRQLRAYHDEMLRVSEVAQWKRAVAR